MLSDTLTVGVLYIFISYIRSFFWPIQEIAQQLSTLQNAFASAEKIFTLLDEKSVIQEIDNPIRPEKLRVKLNLKMSGLHMKMKTGFKRCIICDTARTKGSLC